MQHNFYRCGTVLIICAGLSALLASMALTFLLRVRSDVEESIATVRDAQARIMLYAACHYIQEASRLGYDKNDDQYHEEAYGWIDVRDGAIGPKPSSGTDLNGDGIYNHLDAYGEAGYAKNDDRYFPTQTAKSFPVEVLVRTPFAISLDVAPNPLDPDEPTMAAPYLCNEDPKLPNEISNLPPNQQFVEWKNGIPMPRSQSQGRSWFRLLRCGPGSNPALARYNAATFIVTCGAGGTQGYRSRDWDTAMNQTEEGRSAKAMFGSKEILATLEADEVRQWYLVEWSPAIGDMLFNQQIVSGSSARHAMMGLGSSGWGFPHYVPKETNGTDVFEGHLAHPAPRNFGGTISYIQRLIQEPPEW